MQNSHAGSGLQARQTIHSYLSDTLAFCSYENRTPPFAKISKISKKIGFLSIFSKRNAYYVVGKRWVLTFQTRRAVGLALGLITQELSCSNHDPRHLNLRGGADGLAPGKSLSQDSCVRIAALAFFCNPQFPGKGGHNRT